MRVNDHYVTFYKEMKRQGGKLWSW